MSNTLAPLPLRMSNVRRFLNARCSHDGVLSKKDDETLRHMIADQSIPVALRYKNSNRKYDIILIERMTQMTVDTKNFHVLEYDMTWDEAIVSVATWNWERVNLFQR